MYLQKVISKENLEKKTFFLLPSWKPLTKRTGSGSRSLFVIQCTDPRIRIHKKNVTDLEHWKVKWFLSVIVSMRDPAFIAIVYPAMSSWGSGSVWREIQILSVSWLLALDPELGEAKSLGIHRVPYKKHCLHMSSCCYFLLTSGYFTVHWYWFSFFSVLIS